MTEEEKQIIGMRAGPHASCIGKKRFRTEHDANHARKNTISENKLTIYPCAFCGGYHIGREVNDIPILESW